MTPQEVQERLKLNQLKDKIWYVVPSCATTGEGLFEGLVCHSHTFRVEDVANKWLRAGFPTTSRHHPRNDKPNKLRPASRHYAFLLVDDTTVQ